MGENDVNPVAVISFVSSVIGIIGAFGKNNLIRAAFFLTGTFAGGFLGLLFFLTMFMGSC